jgi:hypothetical protein
MCQWKDNRQTKGEEIEEEEEIMVFITGGKATAGVGSAQLNDHMFPRQKSYLPLTLHSKSRIKRLYNEPHTAPE